MQIREQGRKIQCIRTIYDKGRGRGRQEVVATLPRFTERLPADGAGLEKLTDAEREQLTAWIAEDVAARQARNDGYEVQFAATRLETLARLIGAGQAVTPAQADAIWQGLALVGKALRKAKHLKPKPGATDAAAEQGEQETKK